MSQIALADVLGTDSLSLSGVLVELRDALGAVINVNGLWSVTYHATRLSADTLSASLPGVVFLDETTSTNDEAMKRSSPNFVFSEYQMAGRGRRNKRWFSLPRRRCFVFGAPADADWGGIAERFTVGRLCFFVAGVGGE